MKIGFIGGGNMARSIIGGLVKKIGGHEIHVSDPDANKLEQLKAEFGIQAHDSNNELVAGVDVVVLAVKPQVMERILRPLASSYKQSNPLIISIAAGVLSGQILEWLECENAPCIRVMPNTPALVQTGASGLYAVNANAQQRQIAEDIMNGVGISVWLNEETQIDAVTGISGSGPAYFFYLMEGIYKAGMENGLDQQVARELTMQTALGAAKLACASEDDFETLRRQVTSPGGTTERAINIFSDGGFLALIEQAVSGAVQRSRELSEEQG